jgi:ParB family transcriptional regulator, chromosome partitioning protein
MEIRMVPVESIKVGERIRKNMGDIGGLARNIAQVNLLHPITITGDGCLVAGARRLAAVKLLGWSEIPARILEAANDDQG